MDSAMKDRAAGVLLGQGCGDALGVHYEFGSPPTGEAQMAGGGLGSYEPGEWSDDTQMAICIARVSTTGVDLCSANALDEIAVAFEEWFGGGPSDIGNQTGAVLLAAGRLEADESAQLTRASRDYYEQHRNRAAGNGALMRTSVVGLSAIRDRMATATTARAIASLTHADPLAGDSCVLWSEAIRVAVTERRLDVRTGLDLIPAERQEQWSRWIDEAEAPDVAPQLRNNGFTVTALQAAWHAIVTTPEPVDDREAGIFACQHLQLALHAAVRIGGDTDTVAAIAGGLLGAYWGASAVPASWRRVLHGWPGKRARHLVAYGILTANGGRSDDRGWPTAPKMSYPWVLPAEGVKHPADDGVVLGDVATIGHGCDAVVSLCQRGTAEVPLNGSRAQDHVEVWLMDSEDPAKNPNLDFVLADTAAVIADLRAEGRRVLLHCVAAQHRTPTMAVAYAVHMGQGRAESAAQVHAALPSSLGDGHIWDRVRH